MKLKLERQYAIRWTRTYSDESKATSKVMKKRFKKKLKQSNLSLHDQTVTRLSIRAINLNKDDLQYKDLNNRMEYIDINSGLITKL